MTSTEIAVRQPAALVTERDIVDGWVDVVKDVARLADHIAETDFVPKALRNKPAAIAACILTGRELGIGPMASLKSIHMVQGVPSLSAEYKRARALAAGHQIVIDESTATRCVVRGRRAGSEAWLTITWTMDMAKRAKIASKDVWQQYPQRMLQARATSELCDLMSPDASLGLPTTEELEDGGALAIDGVVVVSEEAATEAARPAARTAQRRQRAEQKLDPTPASGAASAATSEATPPDAPAQTARPARTNDGLPPLPGEDEDPTPSPQASSSAGAAGPSQPGTPQPSASSPGNSEPEPGFDPDARGTATRGKRGQLTALWTVLTTVYDFTDKDMARGVVEKLVSRQLDGGTTGDLSYNEAKGVLNSLDLIRTHAEKDKITPREQLIVFLTKIDEAIGGGDGA